MISFLRFVNNIWIEVILIIFWLFLVIVDVNVLYGMFIVVYVSDKLI